LHALGFATHGNYGRPLLAHQATRFLRAIAEIFRRMSFIA
jgi:hypothetical protein